MTSHGKTYDDLVEEPGAVCRQRERAPAEQGDSPEAIRLINADNGLVITQLTRADFAQLRDLASDDLAHKLDLFVGWMDGKRLARLGTRGRRAVAQEPGLSSAMLSGLAAMPVRCPSGNLPPGAPSSGTLQALSRRGLVMRVEIHGEPRWIRTALGEAVWANR